ncbi:MAG: hypothetical protein ACHBN1_33320 [Heteroscytonema crispum UTEX LB 1556]
MPKIHESSTINHQPFGFTSRLRRETLPQRWFTINHQPSQFGISRWEDGIESKYV